MEEYSKPYNFFYQKHQYNGKFTLENLAFNAYLQEFAARREFNEIYVINFV